jgi:hypothetical protein
MSAGIIPFNARRPTRHMTTHGHRFVRAPRLHLVVRALALLTPSAFERVRLGLAIGVSGVSAVVLCRNHSSEDVRA